MKDMKTSLITNRELVEGESYEVVGIYDDMSGESYYQTKIGDRTVLYHVSDFKPAEHVDDDEF